MIVVGSGLLKHKVGCHTGADKKPLLRANKFIEEFADRRMGGRQYDLALPRRGGQGGFGDGPDNPGRPANIQAVEVKRLFLFVRCI
jgi:hypothetical protein